MIFSTFRKTLLVSLLLGHLSMPSRAQGEASNTIAPAEKTDASTDMRPVAATVAKMLEQGHYLHPLSLSEKNPPRLESENPQTMSERVLKNYLQMLDYMHLYFTQDDVNEFMSRFGPSLSSQIPSGDLNAPREIFTRFRQRVEERVSKNKSLAEAPHDFKSSKTVEIDRKKAPWPASTDEADRLWSDRIEAELLQESLNEHPLNPPAKVVTKRYNQFLKNVNEQTDEEVIKTFLVALAQSYDPHSEYMSPSDMENFNIQMRLSLVGIGAVLRTDDGYAKIVEVVPGGPADKDGRLKPNDRIAAVAQGKGPYEDVVDMKLDKVVEKIRGAKGSQVRIQVIPANSTDPSKRNVIEITREEVKLKESEAKGEVIDYKEPNGKIEKFGWLTVPSFYAEMDRHGEVDAKSTTKDVRKILGRMKKEGIEGLVIDLRRDGGGSLEEAINLTGLFVGAGPVVQAKDATGRVSVARDDEKEPFYTGPVIVLVNRLSASASEIFAAALQDYGRAVIVGDERSFGKGTVQTLLDVGKFMPLFHDHGAKAGSLKLTIQKFYRVSGGSTQHRGVLSDIVLPSTTDTPEIGESSLPNPLAYDEVDPQPVRHFTFTSPLIEELKNRSSERVSQDAEFAYINEDMKRFREKLSLNQLSLNEKQRRDEMAKDKQMKKSRLAERKKMPRPEPVAYEVTLDTVEKEKLPKVTVKGKLKAEKAAKAADGADGEDEKEDEGPFPDPIKAEALNILNDLANQMQGTRTAKIMDRE
jgi:carboxyl-terminal processing protease